MNLKDSERDKLTMPDFLIIGAMKAGTTSLYQYLKKHPLVDPPIKKEVHYFDYGSNYKQGLDWYRGNFPALSNTKPGHITGEASPTYLPFSYIPKRVFEVMPKAKLLVILRNPVDRAYSHYHHSVRKGRQSLTFEEAIGLEERRLLKISGPDDDGEARNTKYLKLGMYAEQLHNWMKVFPREQFLILNNEEFFQDPISGLQEVADFLNLPAWDLNQFKQHNSGQYSDMDPATRNRLVQFFKPHNEKLYRLLGREFDWDK